MKLTDIIAQYLLSKEDNQERNQLTEWHDDTSKNIDIIKDLDTVWETSQEMDDYADFDTNSAWSALDTQITEESDNTAGRITKILIGLAIVALGYFTWSYLSNQEPDAGEIKQFHQSEADVMSFAMQDASQIWLNTQSSLKQSSDFKITRDVTLEGQGYFQIAKDRNRPFIINTGNEVITVLGTAFDLNTYDNVFDLKVTEGRVAVDTKKRIIEVSANHRLTKKDGVYALTDWYEHSEVDWRFENLAFDNAPLEEVLATLSQTFQVSFENPDQVDLSNCLINTKFIDESITDILYELEIIINLQVETLSDNSYQISSLQCK